MNDPCSEIAGQIVQLETDALRKWGEGDPSGFLELSADDVSYFDPFIKARIDSKEALTELYASITGQVSITECRIINPRVQVLGEIAILTFRFESKGSEGSVLWNTTEVYRKLGGEWKIVHTHWALPNTTISE